MFGFLFRRKRREEEMMRLLVRMARTLERIELMISLSSEDEIAHAKADESQQISSEKIRIPELTRSLEVFNDGEPVINYLKSKGFGVLEYSTEIEDSDLYDKFALRIGSNYQIFHDFMDGVKKSYHTGKNIPVYVKDLTPEEKSIVIQTSKELYENAVLDYSYYKRNTGILRVHLNSENNKGVSFMLGKWLERYVLLTCISCLYKETTMAPYSFATNIHVETPSRQSAEFDIMFKLGDEIYWIEAKSGDYQHYIGKYANLRKELELKKHNAMLVIAGITKSIAKNLSDSFSLKVIPVEDLENEIRKIMIYQEKNQRKILGIPSEL